MTKENYIDMFKFEALKFLLTYSFIGRLYKSTFIPQINIIYLTSPILNIQRPKTINIEINRKSNKI